MDFTNWDKEDIEDLARALGYEGDNNTTNMCVFIRSAAENKRLIKAYKQLARSTQKGAGCMQW
jgi:hypothetical protein